MLNDVSGMKVYIATGYTDLRQGVDGLTAFVTKELSMDPFGKDTLFLFCGRRADRIKGLLWEGDGFLLLYKRLGNGSFSWPRNAQEAMEITEEQYRLLMSGFSVVSRHPVSRTGQKKSLF